MPVTLPMWRLYSISNSSNDKAGISIYHTYVRQSARIGNKSSFGHFEFLISSNYCDSSEYSAL